MLWGVGLLSEGRGWTSLHSNAPSAFTIINKAQSRLPQMILDIAQSCCYYQQSSQTLEIRRGAADTSGCTRDVQRRRMLINGSFRNIRTLSTSTSIIAGTLHHCFQRQFSSVNICLHWHCRTMNWDDQHT